MISNNKSLPQELLVTEVQGQDKTHQKTVLQIESNNTKTLENSSNQMEENEQLVASNDPWKGATIATDEQDLAKKTTPAKLSLLISNKDDVTHHKSEQTQTPLESLSQEDRFKKFGVLKPSQVLLDNWKVWMALEVVRRLKDDNFGNIEDYFELPMSTLQKRFEIIYRLLYEESRRLRNSINITQSLPQAKALLEQYYFDTVTFEVQKISADPSITDISVMKKTLYLKVQSIKPKSLINLMQATANKLLIQKNHAQAEEHKYIEMEFSASQAYMKISQIESSDQIESAWNAIEMSVKSKLRALEQNTIAQLYTDVIVHCNLYCKWGKRSLKVLEQIECSLLEKSSMKPICIPNISAVNIEEEQKSLERWIGHCTNHWGIAPVNWLSIEEKLLENLENTARSLFQDFLDQFMEYIIIEDDKKTSVFNKF